MSHPSLIEIEPTTSEFTLKYNNGGNVEDIITINPVGKFIDGNDITLKNFTYSNINIEESKVKNLSMENLIVDGKFTFNSYVPGNELVATTDALATNMGNKIQLSTYEKWADDNNGITSPIDATATLSELVYVSPDGEYKIISEKLSGWSYNIPKLYLLKMDSTTKQFEVQFEFSEKIAYRYRNSLPLENGVTVNSTNTDTTNFKATRVFGGINQDGGTSYNCYQAYYNSSWTVDAIKGTNDKYTRLFIAHRFDYQPIDSSTNSFKSFVFSTVTSTVRESLSPYFAAAYDLFDGNGSGYTIGSAIDYHTTQELCPHTTRAYIMDLKTDYSNISEGLLSSGEPCSSGNNDKYTSILQVMLFNDNVYTKLDTSNLNGAANPNSTRNFVHMPEDYDHQTTPNPTNNDLYIEDIFTAKNALTTSIKPDSTSGAEILDTSDTSSLNYNTTFNLENIMFDIGGYTGIKFISNNDGVGTNNINYAQLLITFYAYNSIDSDVLYNTAYICDYLVTYDPSISTSNVYFIYPNHNIQFNSRTNIGYSGLQLNIQHNTGGTGALHENIDVSEKNNTIRHLNNTHIGLIVKKSLTGSYVDNTTNPINDITDFMIFAHINQFKNETGWKTTSVAVRGLTAVYAYKYHLRQKSGADKAFWISDPDSSGVATFDPNMINKNQLLIESYTAIDADHNILEYLPVYNNDDISDENQVHELTVQNLVTNSTSIQVYDTSNLKVGYVVFGSGVNNQKITDINSNTINISGNGVNINANDKIFVHKNSNFTNITIDENITYLALGNPTYSIFNSSGTNDQNYQQGKVWIYQLNTSTLDSMANDVERGITIRDETKLANTGYFDLGGTIVSTDFTKIQVVPNIKNADIENDYLVYANIGYQVQLNSIVNQQNNQLETYLITAVPGNSSITSASGGDDFSTSYQGNMIIFQLQANNDTSNLSEVIFDEKFIIPSMDITYNNTGKLKDFSKYFFTLNDLSKIYTINYTLTDTVVFKEISFDKKFSVIGDSAYYNSSNHFFRNTVRFSGNLIQDSGETTLKKLTVDDFALELFRTSTIMIGRAKQTYYDSQSKYEVSVKASIMESDATSLELSSNNTSGVTSNTGLLQLTNLDTLSVDFNRELIWISNNNKYAITSNTSANGTYPTIYFWTLNYENNNHKKTIILTDNSFNDVIPDGLSLPAELSDRDKTWRAVSDKSDRIVLLALTFDANDSPSKDTLARFFVLKLNDKFNSIDSSFNIKPLICPTQNVYSSKYIFNEIGHSRNEQYVDNNGLDSFTVGNDVYFTVSSYISKPVTTINSIACGYVFNVNIETENTRVVDIFLPTRTSIDSVQLTGYEKDGNGYVVFLQSAKNPETSTGIYDAPLGFVFKYSSDFARFNTPYYPVAKSNNAIPMIPFNGFNNSTTWKNVDGDDMTGEEFVGENLDQNHITLVKNYGYPSNYTSTNLLHYKSAGVYLNSSLKAFRADNIIFKSLSSNSYGSLMAVYEYYSGSTSTTISDTQLLVFNPVSVDPIQGNISVFNFNYYETFNNDGPRNAGVGNSYSGEYTDYHIMNDSYSDNTQIDLGYDSNTQSINLISVRSNLNQNRFLILKFVNTGASTHLYALDGYSFIKGILVNKKLNVELDLKNDSNNDTANYRNIFTYDDLETTLLGITYNSNITDISEIKIAEGLTKINIEEALITIDAKNTEITGILSVNNASYLTDLLSVEGITYLADELSVSGHTMINNALSVHGATRLDNTLSVNKITYLTDELSVSGHTMINNQLSVHGATQLDNTLSVTGGTYLENILSVNKITYLTDELSVSGHTMINNQLSVHGATQLDNTLSVNKITYLTDELSVSGHTMINNQLSVHGATQLDNTLSVNKITYLTDELSVSGHTMINNQLSVHGATQLDNTLSVNKITYLTDELSVSGHTMINNQLSVHGATRLDNTLSVNKITYLTDELSVSGHTMINNQLSVHGATRLDNTLSVNKITYLTDELSVSGHTMINNQLSVHGATQLDNTLSVNKITYLTDELSVSGHTMINNQLSVHGATQLDNTLSVNKITYLTDELSVSGHTMINNQLSVHGATQLDNTLSVNKITYLTDELSVSGHVMINNALSVHGATQLDNTLSVNKITYLTDELSVSGHTMINNQLSVHGATRLDNTLSVNKITYLTDELSVSGHTMINNQLSVHGATRLDNTLSVNKITYLTDELSVSGHTMINNQLSVHGATRLDNTLSVNKITYLTDELSVSGHTMINNQLSVHGATRLDNTLSVNKITYLTDELSVSGHTMINNALSVHGATRLDNTLSVNKITYLTDELSVSGHTMINNQLSVHGATQLDNTLSVNKITYLTDELSVSGHTMINNQLSVHGATQLDNTLSVNKITYLTDELSVSGHVMINNVLSVHGATQLDNTLSVNKITYLTDELSVSGHTMINNQLSVHGATRLDNTLSVNKITYLTDELSVSGHTMINNQLSVHGATQLDNTLSVNKITYLTDELSVSGHTMINNQLSVHGATRLDNTLSVNKITYLTDELSVSGHTMINNQLSVHGATQLDNTLSVNKITYLTDELSVSGHTMINNQLSVHGATQLGNTLSVNKITYLTDELSVSGHTMINNQLSVHGATQLDNSLSVNKITYLTDELSVSGHTMINNQLSVHGATQLDNTLSVNKITYLTDELSVSGHTMINNQLSVHGATRLDNTLSVNKITYLTDELSVSGHTMINNQLSVHGATQLGNTLSVNKITYLTDELSVSGHVMINNQLSVHGATRLDNTLSVNKITYLTDELSVSGHVMINNQLSVHGATRLDNTLSVNKITYLTDELSVSGHTMINNQLSVHGATRLDNTLSVNKITYLTDELSVSGHTMINNQLSVHGATRLDNTLSVNKITYLTDELSVSGHTMINNQLSVHGATRLDNTLSVNKITYLTDELSVSGHTMINNQLSVHGATRLDNTLSVNKITYLTDELSVSGHTMINNALSVHGATSLDNTLSVNLTTYLTDELSVSGTTYIDNNLSVTGWMFTENTLYLKNNGWVKESINNNNTEIYYTNGKDAEGIQVANIDANRKTMLKIMEGGVAAAKLEFYDGSQWKELKTNNNAGLIVINNLSQVGENVLMFSKQYNNVNVHNLLYSDNVLINGDTLDIQTSNERKINTSYGSSANTSLDIKLNDKSLEFSLSGQKEIDNIYLEPYNIIGLVNENVLIPESNTRYFDTAEEFVIKINDMYARVNTQDGDKIVINSDYTKNPEPIGGTTTNTTPATRFRVLEPNYNTQKDNVIMNREIGAVNKYSIRTSNRNVDINADFKVYDRYTGEKYMTVTSLRAEKTGHDEKDESKTEDYHVIMNKETLISDTLDIREVNNIGEDPGIQKTYNIQVINNLVSAKIYEDIATYSGSNKKQLYIETTDIGAPGSTNTSNPEAWNILSQSSSSTSTSIFSKFELITPATLYSDGKPILCYGDRVKFLTINNENGPAIEDSSSLAVYILDSDDNITSSNQNKIIVGAFSDDTSPNIIDSKITDEFYLYPKNNTEVGKPIQIKQNLNGDSYTDDIYLKYYYNGEYKDIYIDSNNLLGILSADGGVLSSGNIPFFNLQVTDTDYIKVSKSITFHKDNNDFDLGMELRKPTFAGIAPDSIDGNNAGQMYKSSLVVGTGAGYSNIRLSQNINAEALLIFNNNAQSNVTATEKIIIDNAQSTTTPTLYELEAKDYKFNSTSLRLGTYDEHSDEVGQVKLVVTDMPKLLAGNVLSGGQLDINVKKNSSWNESAVRVTEKADMYIRGGLHQYDQHQMIETGFTQSYRDSIAGKLFVHAYVGNGVIKDIGIEGVGQPVYNSDFNEYLYRLGRYDTTSSTATIEDDVSTNSTISSQKIYTNFDYHATDKTIDNTKVMIFGEYEGTPTSYDGGIDINPGNISFQAKIMKDVDVNSSFKDNIFIVPSTIKFLDRGYGKSGAEEITCVSSAMNTNKSHPFYKSSPVYSDDGDERLAFKIVVNSTVEGGVFNLRRETNFPYVPTTGTGNEEPNYTSNWFKPGFDDLNAIPLLQITEKALIFDNDKFYRLEDIENQLTKTYYSQNSDEKAKFDSFVNQNKVFNYNSSSPGSYTSYTPGNAMTNTVFVLGSDSGNAKGYAAGFITNPGVYYLYQNNVDRISTNQLTYNNEIYNTNNVFGLANNVFGVADKIFNIDNPTSNTNHFLGTILLTNNSFDITVTGTTQGTINLTANNTDGILGGASSAITKISPYIKNTVRNPGSVHFNTYSTGNTQTVLRVVWDGRPIVINNELNVFYQDILIDVMANSYTRNSIESNIRDYIYIPVTVIHSQDSTLDSGDYYYGGPGATDGSGKCKFVVAYDVDNSKITKRDAFLRSINPDNIDLTVEGGSDKVIDKFWDNIDKLKILSMNNKGNDQIVNFNETNTTSDVFIIKVNIGYPIKYMEVIRVAKYTQENTTLPDNLLNSSKFKF